MNQYQYNRFNSLLLTTRVGRGVGDTGALVGFDVLGEAVGALVTGAGIGVGISVDAIAIVGFSVGSGTVGWGVNSRTVACSCG
jgi:hypothetical protein